MQVNIKGKHGRTPLYLAAEEGHVYIVKLLLLHPHIDVNCRSAQHIIIIIIIIIKILIIIISKTYSRFFVKEAEHLLLQSSSAHMYNK